MTSTGTSHGSVTVVNAMPCGIGSTIGADLCTTAVFSKGGDGRIVRIANDPSEDASMARICVRRAYESAGIPEPDDWLLETDSQIPVSRGLKSSSSACNAILRAVFSEIGTPYDPLDLIRLGVECAKEAGVTVTGSFDDACGCGLGGFVITDNTCNTVIEHRDIEPADILIYVPRFKIRKSTMPLEALHAVAPRIRDVLEYASEDPYRAMTENGRIISAVQGVDNSIAEKAVSLGAKGAGMSGSGPAVAIVVDSGDGVSFSKDLGMDPDETIITTTRCGE